MCVRGRSPGSSCNYVCMRVCICVSDPRPAVSPHRLSGLSLLDVGINKQELIGDILTRQLNKRRNKTCVSLGDSRSPALRMCWLNNICLWGSKMAYSSMAALIISKTCLVWPKLSPHFSGRWTNQCLWIMFVEPAGLKQLLFFPSLCSHPAVYLAKLLRIEIVKVRNSSTVETTEQK